MTTIEGLSQAVGAIADGVGKSVVGVAGRRSVGSGVVVAPGRVLTNAHNLWGEEVTVTFADGRSAAGKALGVDVEGDVAVLEVETGDAPAIGWKTSATRIGTPVFGVANPGGRGLRVTFGMVSGTEASFRGPRGRKISGSLEHTAPLLPGSSGGPVVDDSGSLVGINTHRLGEGFYLAIPADEELRSRVDALGKGESPKRRKLGVALASADVTKRLRKAVGLEAIEGLLVRGVEEESPAAKAGVKEGDVITKAGSHGVGSADDVFAALASAGDEIVLVVVRGTESMELKVKF